MANNRVAIRSALGTVLSGNTAAGTNVYTHRATLLWDSELPAILIYTNQEEATPEGQRFQRYVRTLQVSIEARVEASSSSDDTLDALLAEIETLLQNNQSIGGTVISSVLVNTEMHVEGNGTKEIGVGVLTYEFKYIS